MPRVCFFHLLVGYPRKYVVSRSRQRYSPGEAIVRFNACQLRAGVHRLLALPVRAVVLVLQESVAKPAYYNWSFQIYQNLSCHLPLLSSGDLIICKFFPHSCVSTAPAFIDGVLRVRVWTSTKVPDRATWDQHPFLFILQVNATNIAAAHVAAGRYVL